MALRIAPSRLNRLASITGVSFSSLRLLFLHVLRQKPGLCLLVGTDPVDTQRNGISRDSVEAHLRHRHFHTHEDLGFRADWNTEDVLR
jgi:hypothetical protein